MPWCFFLNKDSLDIGQLINPIIFLLLIRFNAVSKHLRIYLFDFADIFSNAFF